MINNFVLTDYAYSSILEKILTSEIKPGERIREDLLAKEFGISRTPVREAINQLVQNGFIVNIKRKGLYCVKVTRQDLLDLMDLRMALESLSLSKCIELCNEEDIQNLQSIIDDFYRQYNHILNNPDANSGRNIAYLHNNYDVKFHVSIANVSKSNRLIKYISEVENTLLIARQNIYKSEWAKEIVSLSWQQHESLLEAIKSGNSTAAIDMLKQHLQLMKDTQVDKIDDTDADEAEEIQVNSSLQKVRVPGKSNL